MGDRRSIRGTVRTQSVSGQAPTRVPAGIRYRTAGGNLALGATTEDAEVGLLSSPSHRANLLNPRFVRIGVGTMDGGRNGQMFVQEFTD